MPGLGIRHYRNLIGLLGAFGMVLGCVGGPSGNEAYKKKGFQVTQPNPGTRVVVRGNHVAAVNQALGWLNDHQLLVVNRQVVQEEIVPELASRNGTEGHAQALGGARKVGATLVVFVRVEETPLDSKIEPVSGGSQPMNKVVVGILGMNTGAGKVDFEGKAWNSDPLVVTERVIQDLTILALEQAWQKSASSPSSHQEVNPGNTTDSLALQMAPVSVDSSSSPATTQSAPVFLESPDRVAATQSEPVESTATPPEQVTVLTEPGAEEVTSTPAVAAPVDAENSGTSDDSSLGLQIASGALSILYTPVKVVYAGMGGLFGGFVYLLTAGNEPAAQSVWDASLKGTYWLTPDHLQGNEPVRFKGEATR
ncbi:MAG: hypothetical protein H0X47_20355 [Nitrospirales bacterium]|nr:hypothetical protein [Nitrospirales bacterium]